MGALASCACKQEVRHQRLTDRASATITDCKQRAAEKLEYLAKLNKASQLQHIPAEAAILHYDIESRHRDGCMNEKQFLASTISLAISKGVQAGSLEHLRAIFRFLDFEEQGYLTRTTWVSGVTMFFGGAGTYEAEIAVFQLLDRRGLGHLSYEKFQSYVMPLVYMLVPSTDKELRRELLQQISQTIFQKLDVDADGKLDCQEFTQWLENNDIMAFAFQILEHIDTERFNRLNPRWISKHELCLDKDAGKEFCDGEIALACLSV